MSDTSIALNPRFPWQRVVRTIVQALIVYVPVLNGVALAAADYLQNQTDVVVPGWAFLILNAIIAGTLLLIGLVTRIMAVPGVNEALTKVGLGSVPPAVAEDISRSGI